VTNLKFQRMVLLPFCECDIVIKKLLEENIMKPDFRRFTQNLVL